MLNGFMSYSTKTRKSRDPESYGNDMFTKTSGNEVSVAAKSRLFEGSDSEIEGARMNRKTKVVKNRIESPPKKLKQSWRLTHSRRFAEICCSKRIK